jgi:hypothetical protein
VETIAHSCGLENASQFRPEHVTETEQGIAGFRALGS